MIIKYYKNEYDVHVSYEQTFTSKACDIILAKFRAQSSALPVSVANRMVAL